MQRLRCDTEYVTVVNSADMCTEPRHCHLHCCHPMEQNECVGYVLCFVFVYGDALFDIAAKVTTSQTFGIAYEMSRGAYIICSVALSLSPSFIFSLYVYAIMP